uniref:Putative secreted protein n=1 Tax=Hemileia vastatrix TaxID=203904 RepID=T1UQ54_9BASI|nr:putative secreted protein [Hemileia vastatrix]
MFRIASFVTLAIFLTSYEVVLAVPPSAPVPPGGHGVSPIATEALGSAATTGGAGGAAQTCVAYYMQTQKCAYPTSTADCTPFTVTTTLDMIVNHNIMFISLEKDAGPNPVHTTSTVATPASVGGTSSLGSNSSTSANTTTLTNTTATTKTTPALTSPHVRRSLATNSSLSAPTSLLAKPTVGGTAGLMPSVSFQKSLLFLTFKREVQDSNFHLPLNFIDIIQNTSAEGICGRYNPETDLAVCLFSGIDPQGLDPQKGGWVSRETPCLILLSFFVYSIINHPGSSPMTAKITDGCNFNAATNVDGCGNIFVTSALIKRCEFGQLIGYLGFMRFFEYFRDAIEIDIMKYFVLTQIGDW